ncbi:hypothetical protein GCM10022377_26840 [Zhihengliuella alba]|uniref:Uncharacterized protein n=1 Tax=Zhihengliuella alba TaxID=547018 RepID=A0ABP7E212_9MICC
MCSRSSDKPYSSSRCDDSLDHMGIADWTGLTVMTLAISAALIIAVFVVLWRAAVGRRTEDDPQGRDDSEHTHLGGSRKD